MQDIDRLAALRGTRKGRVWMIGNGPSLNVETLEKLSGEQTFAMNAISFIYPRTTWRPSFYLCVSSNAAKEQRQIFFWRSIALGIPSFLKVEWRNSIFFDVPHIYWIDLPKKEWAQCNWSDNIADYVGRCHTSMFIAMQIACFLGFEELYLVGCDMGWKPLLKDSDDPNHFDRGYSFAASLMSEEDADDVQRRHMIAHTVAKEATDRLGVKVYNATLGGILNVYPRVALEDAL